MNRSEEFNQAVSFLKPLIPNSNIFKNHYVKNPYPFLNQADHAKRICFESARNLQKFDLLIRNKYLHSDQYYEINCLFLQVKDNLNSFERQMELLEKSFGETHFFNYQFRMHCHFIISILKDKISFITAHFKYLLEVYSQRIKKADNHSREFSNSDESNLYSFPPEIATRKIVLQEDNVPHLDHCHVKTNIEEVENRAYDLKQIQSTIIELGNAFNSLAINIKLQGDVLERIDSNIETTAMNVDLAHNQLLRYFQSVYKRRSLLLKILATVSAVFITTIVIFG